jgi:hypothetical protein
MAQYHHTEQIHNLSAPKEIVPVIMQLINPNSVIDIGCGLGTFLSVFKSAGVQEIMGIDGSWCDQKLLFKNIDSSEFQMKDLEQDLGISKKYDLAVCLEVAEHLTDKRAKSFVEELTSISNVILFSAAIPKQGGDHHYNEQWLTYWSRLFEENGFEIHDVMRNIFWGNPNVYWWYKQNMVLVVKKGHFIRGLDQLKYNTIQDLVHPELFLLLNDFRDKNALKRQLRLLFKTIKFKLGFIK